MSKLYFIFLTGMEPSRIGDPELQTPLRSVLMLWKLAVKVTGDPALTETYLKQGLNAPQIAYLIGYSDISNFLHAFKLWFGESLGKYRQMIID